jgi:hypothetical protein
MVQQIAASRVVDKLAEWNHPAVDAHRSDRLSAVRMPMLRDGCPPAAGWNHIDGLDAANGTVI